MKIMISDDEIGLIISTFINSNIQVAEEFLDSLLLSNFKMTQKTRNSKKSLKIQIRTKRTFFMNPIDQINISNYFRVKKNN